MIHPSPFLFASASTLGACIMTCTACGWVGTGHVNREGTVEKRVSLQWKTES